MTYFIAKQLTGISFDKAIERVTELLQAQGFGILTDIDVKATMKKKLDLDFRPYRILGACNPPLAHKALSLEDKIGTMLPCNVIVQQLDDDRIEVAAVDPIASMSAVGNSALEALAQEVRKKLQLVVDAL